MAITSDSIKVENYRDIDYKGYFVSPELEQAQLRLNNAKTELSYNPSNPDMIKNYSDAVVALNSLPPSNFTLKSTDAIKNAIKMYLMSQPSDYGRDYTRGGPLISAIGKTMDDSHATQIEGLVRKALEPYSNVIVTNLSVVGDKTAKMWKVSLSFTDVYNKISDNVSLALRGS